MMTLSILHKMIVALAVVVTVASACDVSMSDFNAHADGITSDDEALTSALTKCADGGRIYFPSGKYLLSPFNLTSNLELYLEKDATLLATTDISLWPIVPPFPSYTEVITMHTTVFRVILILYYSFL